MQRTGKLPAYSWNLVGSLVGIALFYALSLAWAPPSVWFAFGLIALLPLVRSHLAWSIGSGIALICVLTISFRVNQHDIYSPYQILSIQFTDKPFLAVLNVNHVYFQKILKLRMIRRRSPKTPSGRRRRSITIFLICFIRGRRA